MIPIGNSTIPYTRDRKFWAITNHHTLTKKRCWILKLWRISYEIIWSSTIQYPTLWSRSLLSLQFYILCNRRWTLSKLAQQNISQLKTVWSLIFYLATNLALWPIILIFLSLLLVITLIHILVHITSHWIVRYNMFLQEILKIKV